ncbi:MAG: hypothetical protein PHH93_10465, partial [Prolixibacteraceae bacterium]|nr:hypothetical protein [Prolixibacteraceae bacterium]
MNNKESRRNFIKKSAGASAAFMIPGFTPFYSSEINSSNTGTVKNSIMLTGFAELDISPDIGMEQPGGYGKAFHKTLHDPCKVRAVVFDDGNKRAAIVGVDTLMIPRELVVSVRKKVKEKCGIEENAILLGASHSHSAGPLGMVQPGQYDHANSLVKSLAYEKSSCADPKYLAYVEKQLVDVICQAYSMKEESDVGVGSGVEDKVGFN